MFIEERQQLILDELSKNKRVIAAELSKSLNVSIDTIRRDLIILEENNLLKRTRGGAVSNDTVKITKPKYFTGRDIKDINPYYDAIAEKACYYIKERETIYIGGTSIDYLMIKHLPLNIKYTVITNSIITADELRKFENVDVYIMPGKVRGHGNMRDSLTLQFLQNIKIDLAFIAGPCISSQFGLSNTSFEAASLQTAVMNSARETIWLIPNTKFGVESLSKIADIKDISRIITDCEAVEDEVEKIRNQGIDIVIV
ncbi:MAG: DeoR/GlpR family DNA-binding transcription regulator [Inconstantimicrobium porci]|uniref:DeoR/GlpR family DNA-binding transcription regulator n=1 Tax=Inconstantimicrobium porci TaxID=2652291 RepID=UPI002A90FC4D|nr:DeoR/GlpR family DNA-binding transcription regulator [Inconstantimicrobium porci]MDY5913486.1 DeoR/GlpR family DNA-binding transcription regulator [Inconstantimicrobium porci]